MRAGVSATLRPKVLPVRVVLGLLDARVSVGVQARYLERDLLGGAALQAEMRP